MEKIMNYAYGLHGTDWLMLLAFGLAAYAMVRWERRTRGGIGL